MSVTCLAVNMFYEARGEGLHGMLLVGWVTLNRGGSVCETVYAKKQFSWTASKRNTVGRAKRLDHGSWLRAMNVAVMLLTSCSIDPTGGATYFNVKGLGVRYTTSVKPLYHKSHVFY